MTVDVDDTAMGLVVDIRPPASARSFGAMVYAYRLRRGFGLAVGAESLGVSVRRLLDVESGDVVPPNMLEVIRWARILGCDPREIDRLLVRACAEWLARPAWAE